MSCNCTGACFRGGGCSGRNRPFLPLRIDDYYPLPVYDAPPEKPEVVKRRNLFRYGRKRRALNK